MLPTNIPSTSGAANTIPTPLVETEGKTPTLPATPNFDEQIRGGSGIQKMVRPGSGCGHL